MGKLQEFDITFANNKVVYSPGESIRGTVKIRTGNSLQYKGKQLLFYYYYYLNILTKGAHRRTCFYCTSESLAQRSAHKKLCVNKLFLRYDEHRRDNGFL